MSSELRPAAMSERDPFAGLARLRREIDELFGDPLPRSGLARRRTDHWPAVDVAYASDPPRAIVVADLAGVPADAIALQIEGRQLILGGRRLAPVPEAELYQQVEIERGQFRRVVELGADVQGDRATARYEDGILRIELPLLAPPSRSRTVPIEHGSEPGAGPSIPTRSQRP